MEKKRRRGKGDFLEACGEHLSRWRGKYGLSPDKVHCALVRMEHMHRPGKNGVLSESSD